jgi:hypothetical protein
MQTREIPINEWRPFLDQFSQSHLGEKVTVRIIGLEVGDQTEMRDLPLVGITADTKDSGGERIDVSAGDTISSQMTHAVIHPSHVRLAEDEQGHAVAMQIESADGPVTLVRFVEQPQDLPEGFMSA